MLNVLGDSLRWRREDRQAVVAQASEREERAQQLCIDFATIGDELVSRLFNFVDFQEENPKGWRQDAFVQDQIDKIEVAWASFSRTYNALRIAGMPPTMRTGGIARPRTATDEMYDFVSSAFSAAYPPDPDRPGDEWSDFANAFLDHTGAELGWIKARRQVTPMRPTRAQSARRRWE
jgi:hypothetical protein